MNAQRWQAIKDILDVALDLPEGDRRAYVVNACGEDREVLDEVTSLLDIETEISSSFIEEPVFSLRSLEEAGARVGEKIGPFTLAEEIGRGGMGVVYAAHRHDSEFEQNVAVKILKRGMDTEAVVRRFRYERQILANLRHPYISRLFDGGTTEDHLPFLVMERVDGEPLTQWCDRRHLTLHERIELFLEVCEAVSFAHRNLVVHRDLKPANILVDADGRPSLLDFGIAKLLADEPAVTAPETVQGIHLLTPEYASPEQLMGETITTSADLYALGVVLYELLSGRRPFDRGSDGSSRPNRLEMARRVEQESLLAPSTAVRRSLTVTGQQGEIELNLERVSRDRSESPGRLRRELRGDLDAIVLKALRRNPEDRYPNVDALAQDLRQYLRGLPVEARRGSRLYRARKFLQRNAIAAALVTALLVAMLAILGAVAQQREAEAQRLEAAQESQRRQATKSFTVEAFRALDPGKTGGQLSPEEHLRHATDEIFDNELLLTNPLAKADVLTTAAEVHQDRNLNAEALDLYDQAYAIYSTEEGPRSLSAAETAINRATVRSEMDQKDLAEAELRENIAILRELNPSGVANPTLAGGLVNLADLLRRRSEFREAEELLREALAIKRQLYDDPRHEDFVEILNQLASLLRNRGAYDEARAFAEETLEIRKILAEGKLNDDLYRGYSSLGLIELYDGHPAKAILYLEKALEIRQSIEGDQGPAVATGNVSLARAYTLGGEPLRAAAYLQRAEALCQEASEGSNATCSSILLGVLTRNRAEIAERQGNGESCLRDIDTAIEHFVEAENAFLQVEAQSVKAGCLALLGRTEEARQLLDETVAALRGTQDPGAFQLREAERRLAELDVTS